MAEKVAGMEMDKDKVEDMEVDNVADSVVINMGHKGRERRSQASPKGPKPVRVRWAQAGGLEVGVQRAP